MATWWKARYGINSHLREARYILSHFHHFQLNTCIMMASPVKAREWEKTLKVKCRLCGGARCKRCSESAALAKVDSPVKGLHADWVADCVLAMMRPSSRIMNEYKIAQQFHELNITAVFNLTLPGEHPYCGDGLGTSGFPYDPEKDLMAHNIQFFNFGWEDMTTPTLSFMMDIVKVIASVLLTGFQRVAVHCHAGYGRTGITIACALIFLHNIPSDFAIRLVRRDRPGSIQTAGQVQFVHDFYTYLNAAPIVFALPKIHDQFTLAETIELQNRRLHGENAVNSNLPRVLDFLCVEFENAVTASLNVVTTVSAFVHHLSVRQQETWPRTSDFTQEIGSSTSLSTTELLDRHRHLIGDAVNKFQIGDDTFESIEAPEVTTREFLFPIKVGFNVGEWNWKKTSTMCANASIYAILLLDWLEHLREPLLHSRLVDKLLYASPMPPLLLPLSKTTSNENPGVIQDNFCSTKFQFKALHQLPAFAMKSLDRVLSCLRFLKAELEQVMTKDILFDAICVRSAMALFHLSTSNCTTDSLRRHADCIALLIDKWHAPKRLELDLESIQKLSVYRPVACRLTQSANQISMNSDIDVPTESDASKRFFSSSVLLAGSETLGMLPIQQNCNSFNEVHPKVSNNFGDALISPRSSLRTASPLRIDPIPISLSRREEEAMIDGKAPVLTLSPSHKKIGLSPITVQSLPGMESELSDERFALTFSAEFTGSSSQNNLLTLPSVRDGNRYCK